MKKIFIILIVSIFAFNKNVSAQSSITLQNQIDNLSEKVNILEHNIEFLRLNYELSILNADLKIFSSELKIRVLEIGDQISNSSMNKKDVAHWNKKLHDASLKYKDSLEDLINTKKELLAQKLIEIEFTQSEKDLLLKAINANDSAFSTIKISMEMLDEIVNMLQKSY